MPLKNEPNPSTYPQTPRYFLTPGILFFMWLYFRTQHLIGSVLPPTCGIGDRILNWTAGLNAYLGLHAHLANLILTLYSFAGDCFVLFLIFLSVKILTIRPALSLFLFLFLRQSLQLLVSFPVAPGLVWHDPGFPSLFSFYDINHDFYFSAYVGISLLGTIEAARFGKKWLVALGYLIVLFQIFADIALRSHFTTDIYTSIVTAVSVHLVAMRLAPRIDEWMGTRGRTSRFLLIFLILCGIVAYYMTQAIIGRKILSLCDIGDLLLNLCSPINHYLQLHETIANGVLIYVNTLLDALTLFIFVLSIWTRDLRPALAVLLFFILRQSLQVLISLPLPYLLIWHYPGFPSLLQTYHVSNDLYFSGHTGISLLAALEMARFKIRWLTSLGLFFFVSIVFFVLVLQMHYTIDIFTAIMTVCCVNPLAARWTPFLSRLFNKFLFPFSRK